MSPFVLSHLQVSFHVIHLVLADIIYFVLLVFLPENKANIPVWVTDYCQTPYLHNPGEK